MKKIFTLMAAVIICSASFAQSSWSRDQENKRQGNREQQYDNSRRSNDHNQSRSYDYNKHKQPDYRYNNRERQRQIDQINRECDQQVYSYRNDRSISNYERNKRIRQIESDRSVRIRSFGSGVVIGATASLILGAILSH